MRILITIYTLLFATIVNAAPSINIKKNMPYDQARALLVANNWKPEPLKNRDPSFEGCGTSDELYDRLCRKYPEFDGGCGHVCDMYFIDSKTKRKLRVMTNHNDLYDSKPMKGFVVGWENTK